MVPKIYRRNCLLIFSALSLLFCSKVFAQPYVNGNLSTGPVNTANAAAPAGYSWSELQTGNGNLGFNASIAGGFTIADDFTVPIGQIWNISGITVYAYSTGYSDTATTSPFNEIRMQLFNTDPSTGTATPIFGDLTTNRLGSAGNAFLYRVGTGLNGTLRKIWSINTVVTTTLNPGHYWIEYQTGTPASITSNFTPTSTVIGTVTQAGNNAWQHNLSTNAWSGVIDATSATRQDIHFKINYTVTTPPPCSGTPSPGATLSTAATVCSGSSFTLSLQNNPVVTGLTYIWQSSADGITWTNITGANSETYSAAQSSNTYYQALVTCAGNVAASTPVLINNYSSFVTTQPSNVSGGCSEAASFRFATGGSSPVLGYQWQRRPNATSAWENITNSNLVNGANDDTLNLLQLTSALSGYQFRALFLDTCFNVHITDSATLTVNPITATIVPATSTICGNGSQPLRLSGNQTTLVSFNSPTIIPPLGNIPDTSQAGLTNSILVSGIPAGATITGISVKMNVSHSYVGDLAISLLAPNNKVINLDYYLTGTAAGPSATGFVNTIFSSNGSRFVGDSSDPYSGYFRADRVTTPATGFPTGPTSVVANTDNWADLYSNPNGNWTLGFFDGFTGDEGALVNWGLDITYSLPASGVWTSTAAGSIYNDSAATTPYTAGSQQNTIYVKPTTNATYTAVTSNTLCGNSAPATASVNIVEAIGNIIGPGNSTACVGTNAAFLVVVGTGSNISYQWQVSIDGGNTWSNIPGATSSTYLINGVSLSLNNNQYRVILSNGCGTPTVSVVGTLSVISAPVITAQPNSTSACSGSTASFSVTAAGFSNTYQWQVSTDGGNTWNNIPGQTSPTCSFTTTGANNNNEYRVIVTTCGNSTNSNPATLTIVSAASINNQPSNSIICAGNPAVFFCDAIGSSYQWQVSTDNGATWTDIAGASATTLTINNATSALNNNQYHLVIGSCGSSTVTSNAAVLTVNNPASVAVQPTNTSVCEGDNADFSITAAGSGLTYQWQISTDGGSTWSDIAGANNASYQLSNAPVTSNNNRYRVIITATAPCNNITSNIAILTVNPKPAVGADAAPSPEICQGGEVTLTGTGATTYSWSNGITDGVPFTPNSTQTFTVTGTTNGCSATADITIVVNPLPVVTISASPDNTLAPGESALLTAVSNPAATVYAWYQNGALVAGVTGNTLSVTYNTPGNLGDYYAVATDANGCNGESDAITLIATNQSFISPNPARGTSFTVNLPVLNGTTLTRIVRLYDSKGALVYKKSFNVSGAGRMEINAGALSRGVYTVEVSDPVGRRLKTDKVLLIGY